MGGSSLNSLATETDPRFATETCPFLENGETELIDKAIRTSREELLSTSKLLDEFINSVDNFNDTPGMLKEYKVYLLHELVRHRLVRRVIINNVAYFPSCEDLSKNELPVNSLSLSFEPNPFCCQLKLMRLISTVDKKKEWLYIDTVITTQIARISIEKTTAGIFTQDLVLELL